ncbi:MAG: hypothetical protein M5R36_03035 [Deltaproteobacteria bacterium]|nr:hypothetical protein [Deltaproteobacteria bacterium]
MAIGPDGAVHISYLGYEHDLRHAWKETPDAEWQTEIVDESYSLTRTSIFIDGNNHAHIAFTSEDDTNAAYLVKYASNAAGTWTTEILDTQSREGWNPEEENFLPNLLPSLAVDEAGTVHIVYNNDGLIYAHGGSGDWTFALIEPRKTYWSSMSLDGHGWVRVAYMAADAVWYAAFPQGYSGPPLE